MILDKILIAQKKACSIPRFKKKKKPVMTNNKHKNYEKKLPKNTNNQKKL